MFDHLTGHSSKTLDVGATRHDTADVNQFPLGERVRACVGAVLRRVSKLLFKFESMTDLPGTTPFLLHVCVLRRCLFPAEDVAPRACGTSARPVFNIIRSVTS